MAVTKFTDVNRDFASRISSEMEDGGVVDCSWSWFMVEQDGGRC